MTANLIVQQQESAASAYGGLLLDRVDDAAAPVLSEQDLEFLGDLNLDQLIASIIEPKADYDLEAYFHQPLRSSDAVAYRQEIFQDLENEELRARIDAFSEQMRLVRMRLQRANRSHYPIERRSWVLTASSTYVRAVDALSAALSETRLRSRGLGSAARWVTGYTASAAFEALRAETSAVGRQLDQVTYRLLIVGDRVHISRDIGEDDYAADVARTFERFRQGSVESQVATPRVYDDWSHVDAAIIERVARLFPEVFEALERFAERHADFLDEAVARFDREIQFYLAYLDFCERIRTAGLSMCYPAITDADTAVSADAAFDAALANKFVAERRQVICNDFFLEGQERILVVTGPNQGGKTTFARMFAQLHYLGSLGLLVPGDRARLRLPDRILTHFEQGENLDDGIGKLEDDLVRIRRILQLASSRSVLVLNEVFGSTSLEDALLLGTRVLEHVTARGCLCVWVTFLDELTRLNESTVSMVSTVSPDDPTARTFQVVRRKSDGMAHAAALAAKYGLTRRALATRLSR